MTDFGSIVTPFDVSKAIEQQIRTWQRTALDVLAADRGFSRRLERIASYRHTNDQPKHWDEDQLPCCVIVTGNGESSAEADSYSLEFVVAVAVVVGGRDYENSRAKASIYGAAVALLLNQQPGLVIGPQQAEGTVAGWGGFDVGELRQRNLALGVCGYTVFVPDALVLTEEWPATPIPEPDPLPPDPPTYPDTPTAEQINVTATRLAQEG